MQVSSRLGGELEDEQEAALANAHTRHAIALQQTGDQAEARVQQAQLDARAKVARVR